MKMLAEGAGRLGLTLPSGAEELFAQFEGLLMEANTRMNLTAITEHEEIIVKHFLDSLSLIGAAKIHEAQRLIDVGAGAGFPSIPIKLALPGLSVTLLDSLMKRRNFLCETAERLGLANVTCIHGRAEDIARREDCREVFDIAVARAVAALPVLCELCIPFVRVGGVFAAMKGPASGEEVEGAQRAISVLGGRLSEIIETEIPFSNLSHSIIIIKKIRPTNTLYPRKAGIPTKKPL